MFFFVFFCLVSCMAIDVSVQFNGVLLPDIILLTQCYYHRGFQPFKCHEEVLSLQPMIPPKRFDVFPLTGGCSEGLGAFRFFFKQRVLQYYNSKYYCTTTPSTTYCTLYPGCLAGRGGPKPWK